MKRNVQPPRLRVPSNWEGESRSLVIQIERLLVDIYTRLAKLQEEIEQEDEE